ncbi:MAG: hypothetical protein RJA36_726 [Pseudomonadota bacterium]|jgi:phosphoglycolate phosphatase-like HAD superfamily hydrolase
MDIMPSHQPAWDAAIVDLDGTMVDTLGDFFAVLGLTSAGGIEIAGKTALQQDPQAERVARYRRRLSMALN